MRGQSGFVGLTIRVATRSLPSLFNIGMGDFFNEHGDGSPASCSHPAVVIKQETLGCSIGDREVYLSKSVLENRRHAHAGY